MYASTKYFRVTRNLFVFNMKSLLDLSLTLFPSKVYKDTIKPPKINLIINSLGNYLLMMLKGNIMKTKTI